VKRERISCHSHFPVVGRAREPQREGMLDWAYRVSIVLLFTIGSLAFGAGPAEARPPSMASEGPAPDLAPVEIGLMSNNAHEGEYLRVTVTIENQGDLAAWSASIELVDRRPSGAAVPVAEETLSRSVGPGASVEVPLLPFIATEVGEHTLTVKVVDVTPTDENPSNDALSLHVTVLPSETPPPAGDLQIQALQGLGIAGLFVLVVLAILGVVVAVAGRGRPEEPLVPPPPEPPDRRPPPIWPP
jgi:hypothetical protein